MSNLMEQRLRDALAARADQVTPEDLGPLVVPAASGRSRRTAVLAGLAAAAVVAAVVGVPLLGQDPAAPEPGPADPSPSPTPSVVEQGRAEVRVDLDGDGEDDRAWIADGQMHVELSSGTTAEVPVVEGTRILPPVTDAGTPNPMLVAVRPAGSGGRGTTVTYRAGGLVVDDAPESLTLAPGRTIWVDDIGALMVGDFDADVPEHQRVLVEATTYRAVRNGNLVEHGAGNLCWDRVRDALPVQCEQLPAQDADPSLMFPVVEQRSAVGESHAIFDGEYENAVLERRGDGYALVFTWDGVKTIAPVPTEAAPELLGGAISSSLDAPAFVVAYHVGDATAMSVFAPTSDLGFRVLETQDGRFLGDSTTGRLEQRTCMSQASGLWTAQQVSPDEPDLYSVTRWSVEDNVLVADDQGEACLDLDRGLKLDDGACGASGASG
jgi:hypothetical protein